MGSETGKPDLTGLLPDELQAFLERLGEPKYRARQVFSWLHRGASFEGMTDLPRPLREQLTGRAVCHPLRIETQAEAPDGASKFAFRTGDDRIVETVLIPHERRTTVCVSSQIGCALRCRFCATGQHGLVRDLTGGEIVHQVVSVQSRCRGKRVTNVVFMGMGEPLANYRGVLRAVNLLNHPWGLRIGARHIAISTCGLPDQIRRLAGEGLQLALAISLHAATDELRTELVPINRLHPIAEVIAAARFFAEKTGRKVAFQYVVLPGVNDSPDQARRLARLTRGLPAMVNVIPQNPICGLAPAEAAAATRFAHILRGHGVEVAVRKSRGADVFGACGQLRERPAAPKRAPRSSPPPATDS